MSRSCARCVWSERLVTVPSQVWRLLELGNYRRLTGERDAYCRGLLVGNCAESVRSPPWEASRRVCLLYDLGSIPGVLLERETFGTRTVTCWELGALTCLGVDGVREA